MDGDPTFNYKISNDREGGMDSHFDMGQYLLSIPSNQTFYSELMTNGIIEWKTVYGKAIGSNSGSGNNMNQKHKDNSNLQYAVELRFPVQWNELVQGLSTMSSYEFQGWARISTFARTRGFYVLYCSGVHTVYLRNDNFTHILVGDVYRSGIMQSSIELQPGPVGILLPIRGAAVASFSCQLQPAPSSLQVLGVSRVPDLIEFFPLFGGVDGKGLLLTSVFSLEVQNVQGHAISLDFLLKTSRGIDGVFHIKRAKSFQGRAIKSRESMSSTHEEELIQSSVIVAPGQIQSIPLEIVSQDPVSFLPCRKGFGFEIIIVPSRGNRISVPLELRCRWQNQSFLISFVDMDGSVSNAAVLFPLSHAPDDHAYVEHSRSLARQHGLALSDSVVYGLMDTFGVNTMTDPSNSKKQNNANSGKRKASTTKNRPCPIGDDKCVKDTKARGKLFPVLLSMHGTGIAALNQADAYKVLPWKYKDYVFGVKGYWVIAPTRHGAHNWEAVGEHTARRSVSALQNAIGKFRQLPQVSPVNGIIAGHSMGGHGAWMLAVNAPNFASCVTAAASWIKKEEYGVANAFFDLDISASFIEPGLKAILEHSMGEFHVDRLIENLHDLDIHIRVGSHDGTTHPWFSRRMHRLLQQHKINSTFEEVHGKQHWWWDTNKDNDGGVLNDDKMRSFYASCLQRVLREDTTLLEKIAPQPGEEEHEDEKEEADGGTKERKEGYDGDVISSKSNTGHADNPSNVFLADAIDEEHDMRRKKGRIKPKGDDLENDGSTDKKRKRTRNLNELEAEGKRDEKSGLIEGEVGSLRIKKDLTESSRCIRPFSLVVHNPGSQSGLCGIRVIQKRLVSQISKIKVHCHGIPGVNKTCTLTSNGNIRRLSLAYLVDGETAIDDIQSGVKRESSGLSQPQVEGQGRGQYGNADKVSSLSKLARYSFQDATSLIVDGVHVQISLSSQLDPLDNNDGVTSVDISLDGSSAQDGIKKRVDSISKRPASLASHEMLERRFDICWSDNIMDNFNSSSSSSSSPRGGKRMPHSCPHPMHSLLERSPLTSGPVRQIYARPLIIVYGTPVEQELRLALRDLAVYIGNSILAAHSTSVRMLTDLEYRSSKYYLARDLANVLFIGGPSANKAVRTLCMPSSNDQESLYLEDPPPDLSQVHCLLPVHFHGTKTATKDPPTNNKVGAVATDEWFSIGPHVFENKDDSVIFTLPLHTVSKGETKNRGTSTVPTPPSSSLPALSVTESIMDFSYLDPNSHVALGACIHAQSAIGYSHFSRLAWPVVPPMVRAPFANYVPDFMVLNGDVWARGFGAVAAAGFWNSTWGFDENQAYTHTNY